MLRHFLKTATVGLLLCSFVHQGSGSPTDDNGKDPSRPRAILNSFRLNPHLGTDPKPSYVSILEFQFKGEFYDGRNTYTSRVLSYDKGYIHEEFFPACDLRLCANLRRCKNVVRFDDKNDFSVGHTYSVERPKKDDILQIIDDDGALTYLVFNTTPQDKALIELLDPVKAIVYSTFAQNTRQNPEEILSLK